MLERQDKQEWATLNCWSLLGSVVQRVDDLIRCKNTSRPDKTHPFRHKYSLDEREAVVVLFPLKEKKYFPK